MPTSWPHILFIVHGHPFAVERVPIFLRTALSSRTTPLHLHVICDAGGCAGFREAWRTHVDGEHLRQAGDTLSILEEEEEEEGTSPPIASERHLDRERTMQLPARAASFLAGIHDSCKERGYGYLFLKALAAELLPEADHLIVLDPDSIVLGDVAELWSTFDNFAEHEILSMAVDQSDRYYFRLQVRMPTDIHTVHIHTRMVHTHGHQLE